MSVQQNQVPSDPSMADLLNLFRKNLFLGLNCHHIGTVQSFNATKQTANATINYKKTFFQPDANGVYQPVLKDYPQLTDCPVIFLGGGGASLTFPVAQNDECFILFNDRDMDNWFSGSASSAVNTPRLHSFSDAVIIVGLRSLPNSIASFSATAAELRNGTNKVSVGATGGDIVIKVGSGVTVTFKNAGGVNITNGIGSFDFKNNADVAFNTGTVTGLFGNGGKVSFTNATGELIAALYTLFTTTTAGGFPLVVNATALATITSFKA